MKHLALDYHFVRQFVQAGKLNVSYISTKDQLADGLTKPLARLRFMFLQSKIGVADGSTILRGYIKDNSTIHATKSARAIQDNHQKQVNCVSSKQIN